MASRYLVRVDLLSEDTTGPALLREAIVSIHAIATVTASDDDKKRWCGSYRTVVLPHVRRVNQIFFLGQDDEYAALVVGVVVHGGGGFHHGTDRVGITIETHHEVVVIHLETGTVIGRLEIPASGRGMDAPQFASAYGTISGCWERGRHRDDDVTTTNTGGIVMAGPSVRDAALDGSMRTMKKRTKGKRRQNGKQKDGFQRGKCLFG